MIIESWIAYMYVIILLVAKHLLLLFNDAAEVVG